MQGLTFPVALPESFAAVDNVDITLKLSKTPSLAPLVKIYCNPNYGDYALTSASTNAPSRIFSVWQSGDHWTIPCHLHHISAGAEHG